MQTWADQIEQSTSSDRALPFHLSQQASCSATNNEFENVILLMETRKKPCLIHMDGLIQGPLQYPFPSLSIKKLIQT